MKEASKYLIGRHNFKSFTTNDYEDEDYIREIYRINYKSRNKILMIEFTGNGFMRYMIRNMVGTLIKVGENEIDSCYIAQILSYEDRTKAFKTANAEGLYLKDVKY